MDGTRRRHRAAFKPDTSRGLQLAMAALYSPTPVTPEESVAIQHQLAVSPYQKRQAELSLTLPADVT